MSISELLLIAVGLSMDAFAVSICKGLATKKVGVKHMLIVGLWFGGFQALMPLIGYFLGSTFEEYITRFDHWVAFVLLALIGGNMIREALSGEEDKANDSLGVREMLTLAVATSNIAAAVSFIGVITFVISAAGIKVGNAFGAKCKSKAELAGGVILILIGLKILLEHLGVINF